MKKILLLTLVLLLGFMFIGCGDSTTTGSVDTTGKLSTTTSEASEYSITFDSKGGSLVNSITQENGTALTLPSNPTKEGFVFAGWYLDEETTDLFEENIMPEHNITLYAKWEEDVSVNNQLATDTLPIHSSLYGNTNGNLNNQGLAVYDTELSLHYYAYGSSVYAYNPAEEDTTLVCTLTSGGRATFLNLDGEILYFIDSSNGYLLSYHLVNHTFASISETENIYASRTQSWVNFIYPTVMYYQSYIALQRYYTADSTMSSTTFGIENLNLDGTKDYYTPLGTVQLYVMSYSGMGKSLIVNLADYDVEEIHEALLYDVDYDNVSYFALILTVGSSLGLYTYNSVDGLVKVMDASGGSLHSLNFDGTSVYAISGSSGLYKVNLETNQSEKIFDLLGNAAYIQIINHWIYFGAYEQTSLYRINPVTNEIEFLS